MRGSYLPGSLDVHRVVERRVWVDESEVEVDRGCREWGGHEERAGGMGDLSDQQGPRVQSW